MDLDLSVTGQKEYNINRGIGTRDTRLSVGDQTVMSEEGFVIRPEIPTVGRAEANKEKLMAFYQHGYDVMKDHYEELQAYLSR